MSTQGDKLKAIADAIRAKEGSSAPIAANDFPARIAAIETGTQLPTLTNPGTAADMARGKQLIDQNGEIVTGTVNEIFASSNYTVMGDTQTLNDNNLRLDYTFGMDIIMRRNSVFSIVRPISNFGNATAADVLFGKTFTSTAGVNVTGTGAFMTLTLQTVVADGTPYLRVPYTGSVIPNFVFIYADGIVFTDKAFFMLSRIGMKAAYSARNYTGVWDSDDISSGTIDPTKLSFFNDVVNSRLDIMGPLDGMSNFVWENSMTYNVMMFY